MKAVTPEVNFPELKQQVPRGLGEARGRSRRLLDAADRGGTSSPSTTARRSRPACRTTATCSPAPSRTSCRATGRCAAIASSAASAGTATACRSIRDREARGPRRQGRHPGDGVDEFNERAAPSVHALHRRNGRRPSRAWAAGSTGRPVQDHGHARSWSRSGGCSASSRQGPDLPATSRSCRTRRASRRCSPTSRPTRTTRTCRTRRSPSGSSCAGEDAYLLAWTTTPWTLISNLALCVGPEIDYVKISDNDDGRDLLPRRERASPAVYKKARRPKDAQRAVRGARDDAGRDARGPHYEPLFPYFAKARRTRSACSPTATYDRRRHRHRPSSAGLRRGRLPRLPRARHRARRSGRRGGPVQGGDPGFQGRLRQGRRQGHHQASQGRRRAGPPRRSGAQLSILLDGKWTHVEKLAHLSRAQIVDKYRNL